MTGIARLEWRRLRGWALAAAALVLGLLAFFGRTMDLLRQPHPAFEAVGAAVFAAGLLLGIVQLASWRRRDAWIYLLHRPLAPWKIGLALLLCGTLSLLVAIGLPALAYVAFCRLTDFALVDARHWLLPVAGFDIALAGYLCGAFIALAPRRYGVLILVLPTLIAGSRAAGPAALLLQWAIIVWLLVLVLWTVRPDPSEPPRRLAHILLLVAPVQMACWLLLMFVGSALFQIGWIMTGTHPLTHPPSGGFIEASRAPGETLLRGWAGGPVVTLAPVGELWARRGELIDSWPRTLGADEADARVFSHDSMRFHSARGEIGVAPDNRPLRAVPVPAEDGFVIEPHRLLRFDGATLRVVVEMGDEILIAPPRRTSGGLILLSDRALSVIGRSGRLRIPLPGPAASLERADVAPGRNGGWVASFLFGRQTHSADADSFRQIVSVGADRLAVNRTVKVSSDLPMLFRCDDFWLSPLFDGLSQVALRAGAPPDPVTDSGPATRSPSCLLAALLMALVSVLLAGAWSVRRRFSPRKQAAWLMASALLGLPGLIGLVLVDPSARAAAAD